MCIKNKPSTCLIVLITPVFSFSRYLSFSIMIASLLTVSSILLQVKGIFKDVAATTLYDVLHDPDYRKVWDSNMLEGYEICCLNPNNDIGYYACK